MYLKIITVIYLISRVLPASLPDNRIVGGKNTSILNVPYQVSVRFGRSLCGGSLIQPKFVITAAHCITFDWNNENVIVRAGSSYYNQGGVLLDVAGVYMHSNYVPATMENDISLIKLVSKLSLSSSIQFIPIASYPRQTGDPVTVSGWGDTSEGGQMSSVLQILQIPFISSVDCRVNSYYGEGIFPNMICAGFILNNGKDACQGDSGGPLVHDGELVGIVSWGYGCGQYGYPGVYTDVYAYRDWIKSAIDEINRST